MSDKKQNKRKRICNRIWIKISRTKRHGLHYKNEPSRKKFNKSRICNA